DRDEDAPLRVEAAHVLWRMRELAGPLVAVLCDLVDSPKSPAGVQALEVLGEMGSAAEPALPTLGQLLIDPRLEPAGRGGGPPHRAAVIRTLGQIGPEAASAVPALVAVLSDNYYIRMEVSVALARIGPAAERALAARDAVWGASIALLAAG